MARRSHARHQRPSGRAGLEAAYTALQVDLAQVRWDRYADHLELVRLGALADGLLTELQRRSGDVVRLRQELQEARTTPQREDPLIAVLATQVTELRATVAEQQRQLAEATAQIGLLLAAAADAPAASAAPHIATPYPAAVADPPAEPVHEAGTPVPAAPDSAPHPAPAPMLVDLVETPVLAGVGARESGAAGSGRTAPRPVAASDVDDETVRRLRLIRESHGH